jgi:hypothetical protein
MNPKNLLTTFAFVLVVLIAGCKKDDFKENVGLCPLVVTTSPADDASGVPLNKVITATFNEDMNEATITTTSFTVEAPAKGAMAIAGTITYADKTASFTPSSPLTPNTTYTGTIMTSVKDLTGNSLQANYIWTFNTGTIPAVSSTDPINLATGVALNKVISATFSETMDPSTITSTTFILMDGTNSIPGALAYSGLVATFTPTSPLLLGKTYTVTISTGAKNLIAIPLSNNHVWTFSTGAVIAPTVISTDPLNLAANVALNKVLTANFSVAMDPLTVTTSTFTLKDGITPVTGTVNYTGTQATFTPGVALLSGKTYTATISTGAKNVAGTSLTNNYIWTFSTGAVVVPTVISTDPADLLTNVALNKVISATFSAAMDPLTITDLTFILMDGMTPVTGVVDYSGMVATFTPDAPLEFNKTYTATITTGAKNLAATAIANDYVWNFTTLIQTFGLTVLSTNGTVAKLPDQVAYNIGSTVQLTASADPGYSFGSWSGDATGTANPLTVTMDAAKNITANFTMNPPLGPGAVDLGSAANFAAIGKAGISTTGTTLITGNIGVSPIDQTAFTGFSQVMDATNEFSTSIYVVGRLYASDYAPPTPTLMSTAVSDMETAFTTANGMTTSVIVDLGAGDISSMTLAPGLYKYNSGLLITSAGVTLSGGPNDTWVFQIAGDLTVGNGAIITLSGGAQAKNIFWITATQAVLGTTVNFKGNILAQTLISLDTGAKVLGRLLAQSAVTLDAATVDIPPMP